MLLQVGALSDPTPHRPHIGTMGASEVQVPSTSPAADTAVGGAHRATPTIAVCSLEATAGVWPNNGSRMRRESHVRFCERLAVRLRRATHLVVLCRSPQDAAAALAVVQQWTAQADLTLHPVKTRLVHAWNDGFDFLGYHFERGRRWPRANSLMRLKDTIRAKTRRTVGKGLPRVIADINPTLRGWYGYFQHSYRPTFRKVDGWVRRRLRSILRRRRGARGIASTEGANQTRSPNDFLAKHGLFSLQGAYDAVSQS